MLGISWDNGRNIVGISWENGNITKYTENSSWYMEVSTNGGTPQWFISWDVPLKWMRTGGTLISGNHQMIKWLQGDVPYLALTGFITSTACAYEMCYLLFGFMIPQMLA